MAVAEKAKKTSSATGNPAQRLAIRSFLGGIYVLACLGLVFSLTPLLWNTIVDPLFDDYLSSSLLVLFSACEIAGIIYLSRFVLEKTEIDGLRAGSFVTAVVMFVSLLIALGIANMLEPQQMGAAATWAMAVIVGAAPVAGLFLLMQRPGFADWLIQFEKQGWFYAIGFKPTQGLRVRRGTLIGLLVIFGFGVWTAARRNLFEAFLGVSPASPMQTWDILLPYLGGEGGELYLTLMYRVRLVAPVVTFALLTWFSWRLVNYPTFADFLIATEAEMNKVSWTTRRRLVQDTIVVLVTVFLLTLFLFLVDIGWIRILSVPGVLQFDPQQEVQRQRQTPEW